MAVFAAGAVSLSAWGISRSSAAEQPRGASGSLVGDDEMLVGDIEARPEDSLTAHALTEVLRTKLADSRIVRVVPRPAIEQGLARAQLAWNTRVTPAIARDLAVRNGHEVMLTSQLMPVGSGYVLSAHLTTVGGVVLASMSESASSPDALIPALGGLIRQVRSRLGESQESLVAIPPLQQVTTWSIRALELFTQAQDLSHVSRGRGQQPPEMMKVLREALVIDSTFAMAHRRIGAALNNLGLVQESAEAFRAAERFSHKLSDVERLTALVSLYTNLGEYDRVRGYASDMMRLPNGSNTAQIWLTFIHFSVGQYDILEQRHRSIGPIPDLNFWTNLRTYQGRVSEALDSARAFQRRYGDTSSTNGRMARSVLATVHAAHFAYDSAIAHSVPRGRADSGSLLVLAASRFARGEAEEALAIQSLRKINALGELGGSSHTVVESYSALAQLLVTSDRVAANRRLDRVLADTSYRNRNPANRHIRPVLALALAGRARDARREFEAIVQASSEDVRVMRRLEFALARGAIALAERRLPDAIATFVAASQVSRFSSTVVCRVCALPWLGRAYEAAQQFDSAAAVYERYLTTGDPLRVLSDGVWRARILQRLGELHAQRGDTVLAVKRLTEFVELWKDADPALQPEVAKARRRLADWRGDIVSPPAITPPG
jgi:tetratricopeptide (TPR) repeat protein